MSEPKFRFSLVLALAILHICEPKRLLEFDLLPVRGGRKYVIFRQKLKILGVMQEDMANLRSR